MLRQNKLAAEASAPRSQRSQRGCPAEPSGGSPSAWTLDASETRHGRRLDSLRFVSEASRMMTNTHAIFKLFLR